MRNYLEDPVYVQDFDNLEDVYTEFGINEINGLPLYMEYSQGSYEGSSNCWFDKDGQLMYNYASHCSCYGLEGQWDPETYYPVQLVKMDKYDKPSQEFIDWVKATYDEVGMRKGRLSIE